MGASRALSGEPQEVNLHGECRMEPPSFNVHVLRVRPLLLCKLTVQIPRGLGSAVSTERLCLDSGRLGALLSQVSYGDFVGLQCSETRQNYRPLLQALFRERRVLAIVSLDPIECGVGAAHAASAPVCHFRAISIDLG